MSASNGARARSNLRALARIAARFEPGMATAKLELVRALERARLPSASVVLRFHELVLFLRAYPDDAAVLAASERALRRFGARSDVKRFRTELDDSGIAGTDIAYRFYAPTATWLARRFRARLVVDWDEFENDELLERNLWLLVLWAETPALDVEGLTPRDRVRRLKGPRESDAQFLVRRIDALPMHVYLRERFAEELDLPLRLRGGPKMPSRTLARHATGALVFQREPLRRGRPDLHDEIARPPRSVRAVTPREGAELVTLAREAMVTRARDLEAFMHADPRDVRLVDCGSGLQFACMGVVPDRRLLLEAVYGLVTLQNGVPIGYVLASSLFRSVEVAYNVFSAFRGAEAAWVYARALATVRALFGADSFMVPPYQLGHHNEEGIESGAWWFYAKLGFRPRDARALSLARAENARVARDREHRSSRATLEKLAAHAVYWHAGRPREDVLGALPLERVGVAVTKYVARRFGSDRERATAVCAGEAAALLGLRRFKDLEPGPRLWFERWAPLVAILPGVARWSAADRRALARVIVAKGARRESDYVRHFDANTRLRQALRRLALDPSSRA
jgi:hypothetical protein